MIIFENEQFFQQVFQITGSEITMQSSAVGYTDRSGLFGNDYGYRVTVF